MRLPNIEIKIGEIEYDNTFEHDIRIDRTNLDHEFSVQAENYAYYAFLAEEAKYLLDLLSFELEHLYATIDCEKRAHAETIKLTVKSFKYTEKMCENEVITDERYVMKKKELLKIRKLAKQLDQAAKAISQKRDMLQQMGAHTRNSLQPHRVVEQLADNVKDIIKTNRSTNTENSENAIQQKTARRS